MKYTLKNMNVAIVVLQVLIKNENVPVPLKLSLQKCVKDLKDWYTYLKEKDSNV